MTQPRTDSTTGEFLLFDLQASRYAVPLSAVREVTRAAALTPLAGAPAVVEGILDLRGELVPVFGLRRRFGLPQRPLHPDERFVVVQAAERTVALRVDAVQWTTPLDVTGMEELDQPALRSRHFPGVARLEDGVVLIHDVAAFLTAAEAAALDTALEASAADS